MKFLRDFLFKPHDLSLESGKNVKSDGLYIPFWIRWGIPLVLVLAFRLPYFGLTVLNSDEGLYSAVARAMQMGGLPYRDAWDHAAPGIFYLYRLLFGLFGPWSMGAVRLVALLAHLAGGLVIGGYVRKKHGDISGIFAAAITITAIGGYLPADVISGLTEIFLLPFFLVFTGQLLKYSDKGKANTIIAGVFLAIAAWFKIHAIILSVFIIIGVWAARKTEKDHWTTSLLYSLKVYGWAALAYFLLVLPMWIAGGFYPYMTIYIGYNIFYFRVGSYDLLFFEGLWSTIWQWGLPNFLTVILALTGLVYLLDKDSKNKARGIFFVFALIGGFVTGITGARLFGHYFIPAAALFAWTATEGAAFLINIARNNNLHKNLPLIVAGGTIAIAGILLPLTIFHGDAYRARSQLALQGGYLRTKFPDLTFKIRELTRPDEKIWVWGFAPEIYTLAHRDCSSRFINTNYLVGLVPWVNAAPNVDTTPYIIPGSWELLGLDLENIPPTMIVDAAEANYQFWGKYPMQGNKNLINFVNSRYLYLGKFDKFGLYVRNDIARREGLFPVDEPAEDDSGSVEKQE